MSEPSIELHGVTKRFGRARRSAGGRWWQRERADKIALHPLDLTMESGSTTGVIGPNGSGKSTLVRILGTLLLPDEGRARVFGHDVVAEPMEARRHLNRVSVEAAFFKELSPWENLLYAARLYGATGSGLRARVQEVLDRLGLPSRSIDRPMRELSRGQQQKVAIARSLLTSPMLVLMDEPTTGLDPRSKLEVQDFIREVWASHDATILLCTHDLAEAEALADRGGILDRGRLLCLEPVDELKQRYRAETLEEAFFAATGREFEHEGDDEDAERGVFA